MPSIIQRCSQCHQIRWFSSSLVDRIYPFTPPLNSLGHDKILYSYRSLIKQPLTLIAPFRCLPYISSLSYKNRTVLICRLSNADRLDQIPFKLQIPSLSKSDVKPATIKSFPSSVFEYGNTDYSLIDLPSIPFRIHIPSAVAPLPSLKCPVVLLHGLFGYDSLFKNPLTNTKLMPYFGGINNLYSNAGIQVLVPMIPRAASIESRARAIQIALGIDVQLQQQMVENIESNARNNKLNKKVKSTPSNTRDRQEVQNIKLSTNSQFSSKIVDSQI